MSSEITSRIKKSIRRTLGLWRWLLTAANPAASYLSGAKKRLLIIYDYSSQPFSVGDVLILQEASLVLREKLKLDRIDFALVYDRLNPVVRDPAFSYIEPEDFPFHLSSFLPAAQVNPYLGSLCLFDSHRQLESYIADNIDAYHVWPGVTQYASREYLYYYCFNELFSDYFHKHGLLPRLSSRPAAMHWATEFIDRHTGGAVPVTVQLRKNAVNPARNSDYDSWLAFFQRCAGSYAAKFIVICSHAEIDPRFRALPNVIIAKELGTALEQELALIEIAAIHMGASSGPGTIAQFNDKPYCIFNPTMGDGFVKSFKLKGDRGTFIFSSPHQYWIHGKETPDILLREFDLMWEAVKGNHAHSNQEKLLIDR